MVAETAGEALDNAHDTGRCDVGLCLKYVRTWWEVDPVFGSAIEAWNGARHKHPGDRKPPAGAPLFYAGGTYGHIVIGDPHEGMRSTDCRSSGVVSDEAIAWIENTWGYDYLGWTGDLNGVDLPIGEDDEMTPDDWEKLRRIVAEEVAENNAVQTDSVWDERVTVTKPGGADDLKSTRQILRETWQRVAKLADG